jgi:hypothetical protein
MLNYPFKVGQKFKAHSDEDKVYTLLKIPEYDSRDSGDSFFKYYEYSVFDPEDPEYEGTEEMYPEELEPLEPAVTSFSQVCIDF